MNCYKDFAYIYDKLINEDINYKEWSNFILKKISKYNLCKKSYLDLACGTGNMIRELSKNFNIAYGIDLSADMLCEGEEKMREEGIKVKFSCQDITDFKLPKKFNLITCCLDGTNYILNNDGLISYFKCVEEHLESGGLFIFDINSYYKLSEILANNIYTYDDEDVFYSWENVYENEIVDMYLTFFVKSGEYYKKFIEEHREKAYTESFIEEALAKSNLKVLEKLDSYSENEINSTTERIVYIVGRF